MNEETQMFNHSINSIDYNDVIAVSKNIPYSLISQEVGGGRDFLQELTEISKYYVEYKKGSAFRPEGTQGDYNPATLRYKQAANLINKEARFLFAERPNIKIEAKGDLGKVTQETKDSLTIMQDIVDTILDANEFELSLLIAAKDCFVGKRVLGMLNFNEKEGVTISFMNSLSFTYETSINNPNKITKVVCFNSVNNKTQLSDKRIFKKKFVLEEVNGKDVCFVEETLFDGAGVVIEEVTPYQETLLDFIPAVVIKNDGLLGENQGQSEIKELSDFESWYNKLNCSDIDCLRKNMNPATYAVDMSPNSTKGLSRAPGSFWDLQTDQNLDRPSPQVGTLEANMNYSSVLDASLQRIKRTMYDSIDMPDISLESLQGVITSGKALKGIYWPLIVRSKEKMKTWGPKIRSLVNMIIKGAQIYPNCITKYSDDVIVPVAYEIHVEANYPLPEDEAEEKESDLSEVAQQTMSKKSYMKKWRNLTDQEADDELIQIQLEKTMLEDSMAGSTAGADIDNIDDPGMEVFGDEE